MKKIVNICFLVIICLVPVFVEAKSSLNLEYELEDRYFLYEENGNYYYIDPDWDEGDLYSYDFDGKFIKSDILFPNSMTEEEIFATREFKEMENYKFDFHHNNSIYDEETGINYHVYLDEGLIRYYNNNDNSWYSYKFEENPDLAKKLLGEKYDIYYEIKDENKYILQILVYDNIFAVYYEDKDYNEFVEIYDKKYNLIEKYDYDESFEYPFVKEIDGMIYMTIGTSKLNVYKYNGELYNSYDLSFGYGDLSDYYCGTYNVINIYALNNKLFIVYDFYNCPPQRVEISGDNAVANSSKFIYVPKAITQVYSLIYDVDKVNSSSGDFTYEEVTGDDGNIYVELDIKPATGYIVKEIIVTDVNGNKIEVTDNKFIKPMSDVKVEVKYKSGEYLPIPDTFLGKSVSLILIGLILISLGVYTVNYISQE